MFAFSLQALQADSYVCKTQNTHTHTSHITIHTQITSLSCPGLMITDKKGESHEEMTRISAQNKLKKDCRFYIEGEKVEWIILCALKYNLGGNYAKMYYVYVYT